MKKNKEKKLEELRAARSKLYPLDKKIDALKKKKEEMDAQMKSKVLTYDFHAQKYSYINTHLSVECLYL